MTVRIRWFFAVLLMLVLALGFTGKPESNNPARGGTLRVAYRSNPNSLDPHKTGNTWDQTYHMIIYDTLVALNENLQPVVPSLAESWELPNPTTIVFKLRKGVKFQDGTDFNAAAVKFNIGRILNPQTKSPRAREFSEIDSVEAMDAYTVKLKLKRPSAGIVGSLAGMAGFIVSPTAVQRYGNDFALHPVGTGPFKVTEIVPDDHYTFERFEGYWQKGLPYLDKVIMQVQPDDSARVTSVKAGSADISDGVPPKDMAALRGSKEYNYVEVTSLTGRYLRLNAGKPPFNNRALRQAVAWSIDREAIVKGIFLGRARVGFQHLPASHWAHNPRGFRYTYDPAKAKAALAEGGQPKGFRFTLNTRNQAVFMQLAQAITADLAKVGIEAEINTLELTVDTQKLWDGAYQATIAGGTPRPDPDQWLWPYFHSQGGASNVTRWSSPKTDELLDKARETYDIEKRKAYYWQALDVMTIEAPHVYLTDQMAAGLTSLKVRNSKLYPDELIRIKDVWLEK